MKEGYALQAKPTNGRKDRRTGLITIYPTFSLKSVDINSVGDHEKYVYEYIHFLFKTRKPNENSIVNTCYRIYVDFWIKVSGISLTNY